MAVPPLRSGNNRETRDYLIGLYDLGLPRRNEGVRMTETYIEGLDLAAWKRWLEYRKAIRKTLKPVSYSAAQRKLAAFGEQQAAVVEQSIANGWQGLFALKDGHGTSTQSRKPSALERAQRATGYRF